MNENKKVSKIENGIVLDHLQVHHVFKILEILGIDNAKNELLVGINLKSQKMNRKGIIKITDRNLSNKEIKKISFLAKGACLNIIKNYKVTEKKQIKVPKEIIGIIRCFNPNCITNNENTKTRFTIADSKEATLKCCYCERETTKEQIKLI